MSRHPSASETTPSTPPVTPAASAQHDCSEPSGSLHGKQRRHRDARDQLAHLDPHQAPSPSRAESPTARQWANPSSSNFALKRATTAPIEEKHSSRPGRSYTSHNSPPQLSERDSIFATHYLPSDNEAANSPRLPPVEDAHHDASTRLTPHLEKAPSSSSSSFTSKILPNHHRVRHSSHMEVDIHRTHPLHPAPLLPSQSPFSLPPDDLDVTLGREGLEISDRGSLPSYTRGGVHRSLDPSPLNDDSPRPQHFVIAPSDNRSAGASSGSISHQKDAAPSRDIAHEHKLERSSSRSRRGRVEHSIEANLTNAEPTAHVRSRKSSHYLGLFKENTATSPDRKRRDDRVPQHDGALDMHDQEQLEQPHLKHDHTEAEVSKFSELRGFRSMPQLANIPLIPPTASGESHYDTLVEDIPPKVQPKVLPRSLLEEIRNFHLTPGGARGTSFSRSIPTQYAERGRGSYVHTHSPLSDTSVEHRRGSAQLDEEEDEQISSAVYFPHERVAVSEEVDQVQPFDKGPHALPSYDEPAAESSRVLMPERRAAAAEQEANHVDISLRSKNDSRILHGDLQDRKTPLEELNEKTIDSMFQRHIEYSTGEDSEPLSADDSGTSVRDEDSSVTDEAEVTPTATPTQHHHHVPRPRRTQDEVTPVGAVELKPYRHQVGGHTTVFRFSRRAVCKQLNNRENEFYERIERRHPEMLMFLPRYIGVLNVTFSKKRSKKPSDNQAEHTDVDYFTDDHHGEKRAVTAPDNNASQATQPAEKERIFSQKQVTGIVPKVILENNRHIIPMDLFSGHQRPRSADAPPSRRHMFSHQPGFAIGEQSPQTSGMGFSPPPVKKTWGATTVNRKLQEQVLREVFSPPAIHHHRRHARGHLTLPRTSSDGHRRPVNLPQERALSKPPTPLQNESPRAAAIDIVKKEGEGPGLSSSASTALEATQKRLESVSSEGVPHRASSVSHARRVRRRHSGSGLQRRGTMDSNSGGGDLMFFEDEGYGGDKEDEIFAMEDDTVVSSSGVSSSTSRETALSSSLPSKGPGVVSENGWTSNRHNHDPDKSALFPGLNPSTSAEAPANPKEAQTRKDERVQFFLLLEDLTAGMNKPCVLDLKMGTRQYGIEANDKKRKSQRRKCQNTTSRQLGVRLCGMQTWNVKKQEYTFEDKYFGRDLKSGREFQDALTRFLYDGISYLSVAKKIPVILEKLAKLEHMIRRLKRYRFYASSLLILYDGEQTPAQKHPQLEPPTSTNGRKPLQRRVSDDGHNNIDVQLKIVDFANCITGEDEISPDAPCPPQHPDDIDRGYLRGLRTLRMYFQRIMKEVNQDEYIERGEGEGMALNPQLPGSDHASERYWDENVMEDDPGDVSF